jgi:hypothetical protein
VGQEPQQQAGDPAAITADPTNGFQYSYLGYQTITGYNSGNPLLNPETAMTYTLGLVLTPTALRNFKCDDRLVQHQDRRCGGWP